MENEDNILKRIREILGKNADNFSILEHQVDIKVQVEYYEFSRKQKTSENIEDILFNESDLYRSDIELEQKKALLVNLASIDKPEAYRILQRFLPKAQPEIKDWATMACQESRMLLETRLLDEQQVFISTGLGGKGVKLRYFVVFFPQSANGFNGTEKNVLSSELEFVLRRFNGEVEEIHFFDRYATIIALIPLNVAVKQPFQQTIDECNSLGNYIKKEFIITNVKILDGKEIEEIIKYPEGDVNIE